MIYYISSLIVIAIEMICCNLFYDVFTNNDRKEFQSFQKILFWVIIYIGAVLGVFIIRDNLWLKIGWIIIWISLLMWYRRDISLLVSFVTETIFQGLILISDYIVIVINNEIWTDEVSETSIAQLLITLLSKLILFLVVIIIKIKFSTKEKLYISESNWIKFLFFPVSSIFMMILIVSDADIISNTKFEYVSWMISLEIIAMNIFLFYFLKDLAEKERIKREKELLEIETRNQIKYYHSLADSISKQREISHEYKNQMICMQALFQNKEYDKLENYFQQITGIKMNKMDRIDANNAIVNAIINEKYQEATDKGILVVLKIGNLSSLWLEDKDIALILSNLLNNAIAACEKCEKKVIKLKIIIEDTDLVIGIKNTYKGSIREELGVFKTSKNQKELHGIGIKNVKQIVEKYHGYYGIDYDDHEFLFTIVITKSNKL